MIRHIFKYRIKMTLRDKVSFFWMLAFPIVLSLLFYAAFSGISDTKVAPFSIAVVDGDAVLLSSMDESELFDITEVDSLEEADSMIKNGEVSGVLIKETENASDTVQAGASYADNNAYKLTVVKSELEESIVKFFLDSYLSINACIADAFSQTDMSLQDLAKLDLSKEYTEEASTNRNLDLNVIYFYSLIGMTTIMGGSKAIDDVCMFQPNQSAYAARIVSAPIKKGRCFFASISAVVLCHFISSALTLAFIEFVLGISFGTKIVELLLLCLIASFTGVMIGAFLSSLIKKSIGFKISVIIGYTMLGSFLSGMMSTDIKYIVSNNMPILKYINPVNLVTDAQYSLYYYDGLERYALNMVILLGIGIVALIGTGLVLRRQQYASI